MTSRERVLAALNHHEADRIPIDLGSNPSAGISAIAHWNLMNHLNWPDEKTLIYDVVQQLAQPGEKLIGLLGVDTLDIGRAFNADERDWKPVRMPNSEIGYYPKWFSPVLEESGAWKAYHRKDGTHIALMPEGATFFDQTVFPFLDGYPEGRSAMGEVLDEAMDKVLWSHLVHSPWDHAGDEGFWQQLRERTIRLRKESGKALMVVFGANLFEWGTFIRRMDNFLMDLYTDPDHVHMLMELLMERHMEGLKDICKYLGDVVDIIRFGDDLGMDSGPFMGLDIYHEFFHTYRMQLSDYVHTHTNMKTFLHSCGSIYQYLPDLIDEGIDIINPVQTNCRDMDPQRLKGEFGQEIVFWGGGMDPREILNKGTPDEVRREAVRRLEIFAPDGGFVFANIHNILPDVPPENILAMFTAVREFTL